MKHKELIIILSMMFVLSCIIYVVSIDGDGTFSNLGEIIGFLGILIFFFLTLAFVMDSLEKDLEKEEDKT